MESVMMLEEHQRLSTSVLWQLQRSAYCQYGPDSWNRHGEPFYTESNPHSVLHAAEIVVGFLKDCLDPNSSTPLDLSQTLYILDLAPGSGHFGFMFLKMFSDSLCSKPLCDLNFCYVMTDLSESHLLALQEHPYLKSFIREGMLDFACFNYAKLQDPITLIKCKQILSKEYLKNPLILVGNNFFENIPQDCFRITNSTLEEGRISISVADNKNLGTLNENNPNLMPYITCHYDFVPIENSTHYYMDSPLLNSLLQIYACQFSNFPFLFPIGAFKLIEHFSALSSGRLLLLASNQEVSTNNNRAKQAEQKTAKDGAFPLSVNYHAMAKYFIAQQGVGLLTLSPNPQYVVIVGILGSNIDYLDNTLDALDSYVNLYEVENYLALLHYTEKEWANPHDAIHNNFIHLNIPNIV